MGLVRRYGLPNSPKKLIPGDVRKKEWLTGELDTKKGTIRSRRGPVQTQQYAFRLGPAKNLRGDVTQAVGTHMVHVRQHKLGHFTMQELEVDACDTIRLILQFLKENGLYDSFRTLQKETNVSFNTVDSIEPFLDDVKHGRWESVLRQTKGLALDASLIMDLYELIVIEMAEIRDVDVANQLLQHSVPMQSMKATSLERYVHSIL